jgi:hypothetical protein
MFVGKEHATHAEAKHHLQHQKKGPSHNSDINSTIHLFKGQGGPSGLKIFETTKIVSDTAVVSGSGHRDSDEENFLANFDSSSNGDSDSANERRANEVSRLEQNVHGDSDALVTPDVVSSLNFTCGVCGRSFTGDWNGCHNHVKVIIYIYIYVYIMYVYILYTYGVCIYMYIYIYICIYI